MHLFTLKTAKKTKGRYSFLHPRTQRQRIRRSETVFYEIYDTRLLEEKRLTGSLKKRPKREIRNATSKTQKHV